MKKTILILIAIVIVVLVAIFIGGNKANNLETTGQLETEGEVPQEEEQITENSEMPKIGPTQEIDPTVTAYMGTYSAHTPEKLALANSGKVVLFFRAPWCPTCRALDNDIRAHLSSIPRDIHILDVDYDKETALKQKYGVTYQHTLVQVDSSGNMIAKWTGSPNLATLLQAIK